MKWLIIFFSIHANATDLALMKSTSSANIIKIQDEHRRNQRLKQICRLELEQFVLPIACLKIGQESERSLDLFCTRAQQRFFISADKDELALWPKSCQEAYLRAEEIFIYKKSFR